MIMTGATIEEIRPLLRDHHYLGQKTADPMFVFAWRKEGGLFGCTGEPVAGIVFASPINRYFGEGAVELTRLVRSPDLTEPLSAFVGWALRWLRSNARLAYCLSYADSGAGHHGGIYQALNFDYVALSSGNTRWRNPETGEVVSGRSFDQRRPEYKAGWERIRSEPKFLYVRPLKMRRAAMLKKFGWEPRPYPKPNAVGPMDERLPSRASLVQPEATAPDCSH